MINLFLLSTMDIHTIHDLKKVGIIAFIKEKKKIMPKKKSFSTVQNWRKVLNIMDLVVEM